MKIKSLARSARLESSKDVSKRRNLDESMHPFASAREYQRALVAAKLDRMMAKPLVGALEGHRDGVTCLSVGKFDSSATVVQAISGSADGELRVWDVAQRKCATTIESGHATAARGCCWVDNNNFLSCGDRSVKLWRSGIVGQSWQSDGVLNDVDCGQTKQYFATCSAEGKVQMWSFEAALVRTYSWRGAGVNVYRARWNPGDPALLASCARDRSVTLYDSRLKEPAKRVVMSSRSNCLAWNPRDPTTLICGMESGSAAAFDIRKMARPRTVFNDHVGALVDLDVAPTGREFATVSADRTVRIFHLRGPDVGKSRECYHAQRMQSLAAVRFTADAGYLLTASDDTSIRLWKSHASVKLGGMSTVNKREKDSLDYRKSLLDKHRHLPEVKRILKHRNLPKMIKKLKLRQQQHREKAKRKLENEIRHSDAATTTTKDRKAAAGLKTRVVLRQDN